MTERFDAIVIGAGQAGPALAVRCGKQGLKTAIIERHRFGGTCVNNGCVPTKTLVASARAAHMARRAADYGVLLEGAVRVDMARVKARKDAIVEQSRAGLRAWLDGASNLTVIEGHARFSAPLRLRVDSVNGARELEAPRIFINVGARAAVPDLPGVQDVPFLNNEGMMHIDRLPGHLVIVGGSYIGLEFAQMYRRFGCRVTLVEAAPRLIAREDEDVSEALREILAAEGIDVRLNASCIALARHADGVLVGLACGDGPPAVLGTHVLLATGRVPNTHDLGLAQAGVAIDARGYIAVDDGLASSAEGVYALGDCNGRGAFTHTSWNDYEIVAANLFDGAARKVSERIPAYALFTDPPLGRVGLTETQVRASGRPALTASMKMSGVGRAREMGETAGFMKIAVAADTREILGAAILGVHGDEVVQSILEVMTAHLPHHSINLGTHIHPTVCELLPTLLEGLAPLQ
jgi:pyruvate/2-oxoglutarate dehydrogenase complex dihydrolipoamide dehydrogenase (E3) component